MTVLPFRHPSGGPYPEWDVSPPVNLPFEDIPSRSDLPGTIEYMGASFIIILALIGAWRVAWFVKEVMGL